MLTNLHQHPKYPAPLSPPKDNTFALYGIIFFTCLVTWWAWQDVNSRYKQFGYSFYYVVKRGQWYRLFTYGFLHANKLHLISNMFCLLVAGRWICQNTTISNTDFFIFYISSMVLSLLIAIFTIHKNLFNLGIRFEGLGASGATNAIMFASLLLSPHKSVTYTFIPLAYFFYMDYAKIGSIQTQGVNAVHLGGMIYGLVYVTIFYPRQLLMTKGHRHNRR
ncbi:MAG: rhomboid family intramembrane serine protease [Bacteroidota bacterium]